MYKKKMRLLLPNIRKRGPIFSLQYLKTCSESIYKV